MRVVILEWRRLLSILDSSYRGRIAALYGTAYVFDGDQFGGKTVNKVIEEFKGTKAIDQLSVRLLSEEVKGALTGKIHSTLGILCFINLERGRLYSSLSGVQHKLYNGQRVILDPKAYGNRDGYIKDPYVLLKCRCPSPLIFLSERPPSNHSRRTPCTCFPLISRALILLPRLVLLFPVMAHKAYTRVEMGEIRCYHDQRCGFRRGSMATPRPRC